MSAADTITGMAAQPSKRKGKRGRPVGRTPSITVFARVRPEIGDVLHAHIESISPKTTLSAVVELAITQYLERHGLWPPSSAQGQ